MNFSSDPTLNAQITAHRRRVADSIEHAGVAISAVQPRGKTFAGLQCTGLTSENAAQVAQWLREQSKPA